MDDLCRNLFDGKNPVSIVLDKIKPGAQYTVRGYSLDDVEWNSHDISKPSQEEFDIAMQTIIQEQQSKNTWFPQRVAAYPSIQQQLDMLYWDQMNGTATWKDSITSVKQQFPKGV